MRIMLSRLPPKQLKLMKTQNRGYLLGITRAGGTDPDPYWIIQWERHFPAEVPLPAIVAAECRN